MCLYMYIEYYIYVFFEISITNYIDFIINVNDSKEFY